MIKQVIIVRKDLNMRKGKIAAQVAHASMKVWFDRMIRLDSPESSSYFTNSLPPEFIDWKEGSFTKVVVSAESEKELLNCADLALFADLPYAIITDDGRTEFHGKKTNTCVAIGPAHGEDIDKITGHLKLL